MTYLGKIATALVILGSVSGCISTPQANPYWSKGIGYADVMIPRCSLAGLFDTHLGQTPEWGAANYRGARSAYLTRYPIDPVAYETGAALGRAASLYSGCEQMSKDYGNWTALLRRQGAVAAQPAGGTGSGYSSPAPQQPINVILW